MVHDSNGFGAGSKIIGMRAVFFVRLNNDWDWPEWKTVWPASQKSKKSGVSD